MYKLPKTVSVCCITGAPEHREDQIYSWCVLHVQDKYDGFLKFSIGYCMLVISQFVDVNISGVCHLRIFILCPEFAFFSFEEVNETLTEKKTLFA